MTHRQFLGQLSKILNSEERSCRNELRQVLTTEHTEFISFLRGSLQTIERCRSVKRYVDLVAFLNRIGSIFDLECTNFTYDTPRGKLVRYWRIGQYAEGLAIKQYLQAGVKQ